MRRAGHQFELMPGDAVHVPLMWPHWVKNGPEPSISFSITWKSNWIYQEADVRGMNHLLRQWGVEPASPAPFPRRNRRQGLCLSRHPQGEEPARPLTENRDCPYLMKKGDCPYLAREPR